MGKSLKNIFKTWGVPYASLRVSWHRCKKFKALMEDLWFSLSADSKQNDLLSNVESVCPDEILEHVRGRKESKFFISSDRRDICVKLLSDKYKADILTEADEIIKHRFRILGQMIHFADEIDWHLDPKSGYRWPLKYFRRLLPVFNTIDNTDGKIPYELSRFHQLTILGIAYWITKDEKYTQEFLDEIESWLNKNPYPFGINWTCTMDVAIRICNMISGFCFFRNSREITNEFLFRFFRSLLQHGRHVESNLECSQVLTSNHYLSDLVGLVYLGVLIPEFKESEKWKNLGIRELRKEMKKQVYPDGVDFEASTCYHRLVLELFFYATLVVTINDKNFKEDNFIEVGNEIFGEEYLQRLYKMFEFVLYALKPNGRMPQIGDNDSGRLHILANREVLDMRYLLTLGAIFFKEPKFKVKEFGFCEETLWVFGDKGCEIWQDLEENCLGNIGSQAFPDAGWYIMRSDKSYMIISCGPNGQNGNGAHCHNDKLSFELCIDGEDIIVDPGTYVYTPNPEWRNKFRSTACHNTVMVDDKEQNRFDEKNLFQVENNAITRCLKWEMGDDINVFIGEHYGYKRFSHSVVHQREIRFHEKEGKLEIIDRFQGEGEHSLKWNFILSPGFKSNLKIDSRKLEWQQKPVFYSPEYGRITKTEKLSSTLKTTIPVEVKFWLKIQEK